MSVSESSALPGGVALFAAACGLSVASISYAQPLLGLIAAEFELVTARAGLVVTITQVGYGLGLLLIVPLGDRMKRRHLVTGQLVLLGLAQLAVATASSSGALLVALAFVGAFAVVIQVLVAYAAALAAPAQRGRIVGSVTSGVVLGILGARCAAGPYAAMAGWRSVYLVSAALTLCVAQALWRNAPAQEATPRAIAYTQLLRSVFTLFAQDPTLRLRAGMAAFSFAAFSALWTPLALSLSASPHRLTHAAIGLFGLAGIAGASATACAGRLVDRGWARQTTSAALVLQGIAWVPISLAEQSLVALVGGMLVLDGAVQALHVSSQTTLYAGQPEARSRLAASYMLFYAIGSGGGALASTLAYACAGWRAVSLLGALFSVLALALWMAFGVRPQRQHFLTTR